jgi:hypothetical protein
LRRPRQAEVEHPRTTVVPDDHVVGLEIAVYQAARVRRRQAAARLQEQLQHLGD